MKPGLKIGQVAELDIIVTEAMCATFDGVTVHELYGTSQLVNHMEWVSRKLIVPYLENHEEAMGHHVEVTHLMPTLKGMNVKLKATITEIRDKKIVTDLEAFNSRGKIARGSVTQVIVEKAWVDRKMKEMSLIHHLAKGLESPIQN